MRRRNQLLIGLALVAVAYGAYLYFRNGADEIRYRFAKVDRGDIVSTVSASGTLNAVITVQVGSQVSGRIEKLLADFNTPVKKGQVIARIAPEIFEAKVQQAQAQLDAGRAAVLNQEANVERSQAGLDNAKAALAAAVAQVAKARVAVVDGKRNLDRRRALFKDGLIPASDLDTAQAAYDSAVAQLDASRAQETAQRSEVRASQAQMKVSRAQLEDARAGVKQRAAALRQAEVDLDNTIIRAPVDGVVVSRNVDTGQTVAASLQAPTLFTIAQDLTQMQVNTSVDEADIGRVRTGQRATFTVDAFPEERFEGRVVQIRKAAVVVQNVVTYDVVVSAPNPEHKLFPGMTANVTLIVDRRRRVLRLPNNALRFSPAGAPAAASPDNDAGNASANGNGGGRASRGAAQRALRARLVKELGLSAEQQAKLGDIFRGTRQAMMALRAENLTERSRETRVAQIRKASREKIRAMLTDAQRARYAAAFGAPAGGAAQEGRAGRVWVLGEDGAPRPVDVRLGNSDGSYTEILSGDLKERQELILGVLPAGGASRRGPSRGLRLGF